MKLRCLFLLAALLSASPTFSHEPVLSPHLNKLYVSDNMAWFDDALPRNTRIFLGPLDRALGETNCDEKLLCTIVIDPQLAPAEITQHETLLHEMCHVETWDEIQKHGPLFHACIRRLRNAGAFDDLL